jgi:hypothetical protein
MLISSKGLGRGVWGFWIVGSDEPVCETKWDKFVDLVRRFFPFFFLLLRAWAHPNLFLFFRDVWTRIWMRIRRSGYDTFSFSRSILCLTYML